MPEVGVVMLGAVPMMDLMLRGRNEDPVTAITIRNPYVGMAQIVTQ